jgi:hypothetical protein
MRKELIGIGAKLSKSSLKAIKLEQLGVSKVPKLTTGSNLRKGRT